MKGAFRFPMVKVEGGGESPDPAVFCPLHGYIPDPAIYTPPPGLVPPDSISESVIYLVNTSNTKIWYGPVFIRNASSVLLYEIFSLDGTLLDSFTSSLNSQSFEFAEYDTYYTVRVSIETASRYFTAIQSGITVRTNLIESITFNTPNVTSLQYVGRYITSLKSVSFNCTLAELTTFANAFQYSGIVSFVFQSSYPKLKTIQYMFQYSDVKYIEFPLDCNLPLMSSMTYFASYSKVRKLLFPTSLPAVTAGTYFAREAFDLSEIRFPVNMPIITNISYGCYKCNLGPNVEFPVYPLVNSYTYLFAYNPVQKVTFSDAYAIEADNRNIFQNCELSEITYPAAFGHTSNATGISTGLRKVVLPDTLLGSVSINSLVNDNIYLEEVTGDTDNTGHAVSQVLSFVYSRNSLKTFNAPNLRVSAFRFGFSTTYKMTKLETLEIDWANSPFDGVEGTGNTILLSGTWSAAWLNALLTKLPTVSAGQTIDMTNCDNYASCDTSIATAKGWTVL